MRIQNLKIPPDPTPSVPAAAYPEKAAEAMAHSNAVCAPGSPPERQELEIALLRARVQHLELVIETARSLMGSNQERLLRRLHEAPREIAALSAQLRRVDPQSAW
jgi:hypothetical protein